MVYSRFSKYVAGFLVLAGLSGAASAALVVQAAPPPPDYYMKMTVDGGAPVWMYGDVTAIPNGNKWQYQVIGSYDVAGSHVDFNVLLDPDPSVLANISVHNNTGGPLPYTVDFF